MSKHGNLISHILLCVGILMLCFACILLTVSVQQMKQQVDNLEEQNKTILHKYKLQEEHINEIDSHFVDYASETDAMINDLAGHVEELKLEKEVKEVELHQEEEPVEEEIVESEQTSSVVGTYELTAYIATGNPCADGVYPQVGYTAACNDPNLWHKWVHIDGYGDYFIHDTGGMASNVIDIFVSSYDEAIQFGRRTATVSIID